MSQRVSIKLEKMLACDLKPGQLFMTTDDPAGITRLVNSEEQPMLMVFMRNNTDADEFEDMDQPVYRVHIVIADSEEPAPPKVNPHEPPGMKGNGR